MRSVAGDRSATGEGDDMRIRTGLALGLLLALSLAGCGAADDSTGVATAGGRGRTTSSATPDGRSDQERALAFARCMRANGVPNFPDPEVGGGGLQLNLPAGTDKQKVDAAQQKCKQYLPNGGQPARMDPQVLEQLRRFARCMRENGVPTFPDPGENGLSINGNTLGTGRGPNDPAFKAAERACAKYQPAPPSGAPSPRTQTGGNP
jgi:hypothetical protein